MLAPRRADAILDVENKGPTLNAGAFAMRITNIGAIGNPFEDVGRCFDPAFEYPRGSGNNGLKSADLWVGARREDGSTRVSGGPLLEWRPTLSPTDHVRTAYSGLPGTQRYVDDDGDGRIDEEFLNGRDDDGDGEVDEDIAVAGSQMLAAEYRDDQPEALAYGFPNGEAHLPLNLDVRQEAYAWAQPGYDRIAGLHFVVRNHGTQTLRDVRIGLLVDLDSRAYGDAGGHVNDLIQFVPWAAPYNDGTVRADDIPTAFNPGAPPTTYLKQCTGVLTGQGVVVRDASTSSGLPAFGVVPLGHTLDPLAQMETNHLVDNIVHDYETAPATVSFQYKVFALDLPAGQGGLPIVDADRYRAMEGSYPGSPTTTLPHDYAVLVSCGPFPRMEPGRSYTFDLALVCGANPDSCASTMALAALTYKGNWLNLYPDTTATLVNYSGIGKSGYTGHETPVDPPAGLSFLAEPDCYAKYPQPAPYPFDYPVKQVTYRHGSPVWTDADCDICTGFNGNETAGHWIDPVSVPPAPDYHAEPRNHAIHVAWSNSPEVALKAGIAGGGNSRFVGYNVYRLSDWRRKGLVPGPDRFLEVASFGVDTLQGALPIASAVDSTVTPLKRLYGQPLYPIGRYHYDDTEVGNGFDYLYVVTSVAERRIPISATTYYTQRYESPITPSLDSLVTPHDDARTTPNLVSVVPNPYRAGVAWDRQPVAGDTFGRHIDFIGLPRARATIRVYTLAGDLVETIDHDGSQGDGEARWNLISRNGQDIVSGVYLYTVDSALGRQTGRFVVIR